MARGPDLAQALTRPFLDAGGALAEALVYLDAGAGEAVASLLGLQGLDDLRVPLAFDLEEASACDAQALALLSGRQPRKLAVLTTRLLPEVRDAILRAIQAHPGLQSCEVLTSVPEEVHSAVPGTSLGEDAYEDFENELKRGLAQAERGSAAAAAQASINVRYFPLQAVALTGAAFTLPAASWAAASSMGPAWAAPPPQRRAGGKGDDLSGLAHALVGLAASLDCSVDAFSLGPTAHALGEEVCNLVPPPGPGGRPPARTAALLLLDRRADLLTPAAHGEHAADRLLGLLPRRGGAPQGSGLRSADAAVPLEARGGWGAAAPELAEGLQPVSGSLLPVPPLDSDATPWLQALLGKPAEGSLAWLRRWLLEALRSHGLQPPRGRRKPGANPAGELHGLSEALAASPAAARQQAGLLQLAAAAAASLEGPAADRWATLARQERQLAVLGAEGPDSLAAELEELLGLAARGKLPLADAAALLLRGHLLAADAAAGRPAFDEEQAGRLRKALAAALLSGHVGPGDAWLGGLEARLAGAQAGDRGLRLEAEDKAREIMARLAEAAAARQQLPEAQRQLVAGDAAGEAVPLLGWLLRQALAGRPVPGMQHHSASLRGLLNAGLGRFGLKQKQPLPSDHGLLLVFVLGGVGAADLRAAAEAAAAAGEGCPAVVCGGSTLLAPQDVLRHLLLH